MCVNFFLNQTLKNRHKFNLYGNRRVCLFRRNVKVQALYAQRPKVVVYKAIYGFLFGTLHFLIESSQASRFECRVLISRASKKDMVLFS